MFPYKGALPGGRIEFFLAAGVTSSEEHVGCYRSCLGALGEGSMAVPGMESTTGKDKPD